ncbi:hypothetical protein CLF_107354 [Clonorchis sinensis]|uniref:Uncharacterized protein n=1 Tax=Clonorchis sinensis TaxID=79923 RepID=G7YGM5_CLOSI|nr:hypothetical protein CLF_107354 [Clonorchis sinensis]
MDYKKQTAYFLHFFGKKTYTSTKNLTYSGIDISYNALKKKVQQHFKPINFVAAERARFDKLTRFHSQLVRGFVLQLQTRAAKCDCGDQIEDQLPDRLTVGIQLLEVQQMLLLCPDQTFQDIWKTCEKYGDVKRVTRTDEAALLNYSERNNSTMQTDNKFKPRTNFCAPNSPIRRFTDRNLNSAVQKCGKCESFGRNHSSYSCPHRQAKCFICGKAYVRKMCHLFSDPNTDVQALSEDIYPFFIYFAPKFVRDVNIRGINRPSVPVVGSCTIPVILPQGTPGECNFLVSTSKPLIIELKVLRSLRTCTTLWTPENESAKMIFYANLLFRIPSCNSNSNNAGSVAGITLSSIGKRMVIILDLDDLSCHQRHIDQVEFNTRGQSSVDDLIVPEQTGISEEHATCEEPEVSNPRRSERLRSRPPLNYKHPHAHSRRKYERLLTNLVLTEEDIRQLLHKISPFCALGLDKVHPRILMETSFTLAKHFHLMPLWNYCRVDGISTASVIWSIFVEKTPAANAIDQVVIVLVRRRSPDDLFEATHDFRMQMLER